MSPSSDRIGSEPDPQAVAGRTPSFLRRLNSSVHVSSSSEKGVYRFRDGRENLEERFASYDQRAIIKFSIQENLYDLATIFTPLRSTAL